MFISEYYIIYFIIFLENLEDLISENSLLIEKHVMNFENLLNGTI
jgi:hypothetical protein